MSWDFGAGDAAELFVYLTSDDGKGTEQNRFQQISDFDECLSHRFFELRKRRAIPFTPV